MNKVDDRTIPRWIWVPKWASPEWYVPVPKDLSCDVRDACREPELWLMVPMIVDVYRQPEDMRTLPDGQKEYEYCGTKEK